MEYRAVWLLHYSSRSVVLTRIKDPTHKLNCSCKSDKVDVPKTDRMPMESNCIPTSPVQHIQVESRVHALSGSSGRERPSSAHEDVEDATDDEILVLLREALQTDHEVGQLGHRSRTETDVRKILHYLMLLMEKEFIQIACDRVLNLIQDSHKRSKKECSYCV